MWNADERRLAGLCASFFVLFFAFFAAQNEVTPALGSFGSLSLGLLYGCFALSGLLAPVILRLFSSCCVSASASSPRTKAASTLRAETIALTAGSLCYAPYIASCAFPHLHAAQMVSSCVLGVGAGMLWVAQGSLLTASCTEENRGLWAGRFWGSFMAGNGIGNFSASLIEAAVPLSTLFLILAAVTGLSTVFFAALVRPRRGGGDDEGPGSAARGGAVGGTESMYAPLEGGDVLDVEHVVEITASCAEEAPHGGCRGGCSRQLSLFAGDLRQLGRVFREAPLALMIPLLLFIGAENAFWGGTYPLLLTHLGMEKKVGFVLGTLAFADMCASIVAGWVVDTCGSTAVAANGGAISTTKTRKSVGGEMRGESGGCGSGRGDRRRNKQQSANTDASVGGGQRESLTRSTNGTVTTLVATSSTGATPPPPLLPPPPHAPSSCCSISRFAPTAVLVFGLAAFCGGLAIITFRLRPEALSNMNNATVANTSSGLPLPLPTPTAAATMAYAYAAAVLMGVGDACANTVMLTRLGVLSDDVKLIPRTTAFQFFQCVNVLMTCASFIYAPALPLGQSVAQVIVLLTLAVFGGACFWCAGIPPKRASTQT